MCVWCGVERRRTHLITLATTNRSRVKVNARHVTTAQTGNLAIRCLLPTGPICQKMDFPSPYTIYMVKWVARPHTAWAWFRRGPTTSGKLTMSCRAGPRAKPAAQAQHHDGLIGLGRAGPTSPSSTAAQLPVEHGHRPPASAAFTPAIPCQPPASATLLSAAILCRAPSSFPAARAPATGGLRRACAGFSSIGGEGKGR
jgi:hypothetical protein